MGSWDSFPDDYRQAEVAAILDAVRAGECVNVVGLSGSGKSNVLGYVAHRRSTAQHRLELVDVNRLLEHSPAALLSLARRSLGQGAESPGDSSSPLGVLSRAVSAVLQEANTLSLLFDRFDVFAQPPHRPLFNALRALRDEHKYRLAYVVATRRPLPADTELAELFHAHTVWLGPLTPGDARWNVARYAARHGQSWEESTVEAVLDLTRGYPSLLKAACQAYAGGASLEELRGHPAVQARVAEFWQDDPQVEHLANSGLSDHPLLLAGRGPRVVEGELTAKEQLLYDYFQAHPHEVCEKDDLIRAVWPEDAVYEEGVRDSSLAQLVRRLRLKIESDPSDPRFVETVPGRGYLYRPGGQP